MGPFRALIADQMSAGAALHGLRGLHGPRQPGRGHRQPAALGLHAAGVSSMRPPGEISARGQVCVLPGAALLLGRGELDRANYPRISAPRCWRSSSEPQSGSSRTDPRPTMRRHASFWLLLGSLGLLARVALEGLAAACTCWWRPRWSTESCCSLASRMKRDNALTTILGEMESMSASMRWLAVVQFCSWFTLVTVFVYGRPRWPSCTSAPRRPGTPAYEAGANWTGVLFAVYNILACWPRWSCPSWCGASACA